MDSNIPFSHSPSLHSTGWSLSSSLNMLDEMDQKTTKSSPISNGPRSYSALHLQDSRISLGNIGYLASKPVACLGLRIGMFLCCHNHSSTSPMFVRSADTVRTLIVTDPPTSTEQHREAIDLLAMEQSRLRHGT